MAARPWPDVWPGGRIRRPPAPRKDHPSDECRLSVARTVLWHGQSGLTPEMGSACA